MTGDPASEVFTTLGWDGGERLMAPDLHFARLHRHARRLGIALPEGIEGRIFDALAEAEIPGEPTVGSNQAPFLVMIGISPSGEVNIVPRLNMPWPERMSAISLAAPTWSGAVRGTKHGDWQPYIDARKAAVAHGADMALLFDDDCLVDGDRCMPVLLDADGVAYHPKPSQGALDSITLVQIREGVEAAGIPVREARLTLSLILRASEMIVLGSGMGVQALASIDGRVIGKSRGRLFEAAHATWVERVENAWLSRDEVGV